MRVLTIALLLAAAACAGCGTTRWSDTSRTATEQLLISDAIDRSISGIEFNVLKGERVYLDRQYLKGAVDEGYLVSTLRQHMLGSGCILTEERDQADFVVEARSGAVGTVRHDVLYGIPATDVPAVGALTGAPSRIPEIPFAKKTDQQGVAKISVFAYHRNSGMPVWQSGNSQHVSQARDFWVLGIGPFENGTIHEKGHFPAMHANGLGKTDQGEEAPIWVAEAFQFQTTDQVARRAAALKEAQMAEKPDGEATTK